MATVTDTLNQAWSIHQAGDVARAERIYRDVVMLQPDNATAWCYLGIALHDLRRYDEAVAAYRRALQLQPSFPVALSNLGNTLSRQGKYEEAAASCRAALRIKPDYVTAYNNLGAILSKQGKLEESASAFEAAIRYNPAYGPAHNNLGAVLVKQGKLEEAEDRIEQALKLSPEHGPAHNNLGAVLVRQGKLAEAESQLEEAVRRNPQFESAHSNLANTQLRQGKFAAAQAALDTTLKINPSYAEARKAQALIWLLLGDFERGWPAYEWRWRCEDAGPPSYPKPLWDGGPLEDRTLLLHCEQGLGDTLNFIRYAQVIKQQRGGRIVVVCQKPLLPILSRTPGIDQLVVQGSEPPKFDVWAPLLTVPLLLDTRLETIPADVPYLSVDEQLVERWRKRTAGDAGPWPMLPASVCRSCFKVGIAWQGNKDHQADLQRSVPLEEFAPLAEIPGVVLYSLQKGFGSEQIAQLAGRFRVVEFDPPLDEGPGPFMDTAAVMQSLDLVISSDTAVAHLAGALGVPVWTALCYSPDWRWLLERDDSPWYPSMRLFRQGALGDWPGVFRAMAEALRERVAEAGIAGGIGPGANARSERETPSGDGDRVSVSPLTPSPSPTEGRGEQSGVTPSPSPTEGRGEQSGGCATAEATEAAGEVVESKAPSDSCEAAAASPAASAAPRGSAAMVQVEVSPGELLDKLTILEIKAERITDAAKLANVRIQLETLEAARSAALPASEELNRLTAELKAVNESLWQIEDDIRQCEREGNFGERFIELARSVYRSNDRRAALKRQIDELLGSRLVEEKSYAEY